MKKIYTKTQLFGLILGILSFIFIQFIYLIPSNLVANNLASIAFLMAIWWVTEAIPLGATSLVPLILFPLTGILTGEQTAGEYINSTIFLFLGGFLIAIAMEKWDLHKRISLKIIKLIGSGPSSLIAGFMIASAFLSMFISNTATVLMMLPIAIAVAKKMENNLPQKDFNNFSISLMLAIAYSSSVGGISTLIGTPPNLVFLRIFKMNFPSAPEISFGNWMMVAFPISLVMLIFIWFLISKVLFKTKHSAFLDNSVIHEEYKQLGRISYEEKLVLLVFILTGLLWMFRTDLDLGAFKINGWAGLLGLTGKVDDGTIAITMASIMFLIPAKNHKSRILTANSFSKIPWEIVVLFGGGFALAKGFQISGLSEIVGNMFIGGNEIHPLLLIILICFGITFLTELTSNTATAQTLLPIIASVAVALNLNPLFLMIPATISASFAFMLPVATPPNAIVFSSGSIKIKDMAKTGLIINLAGILFISIIFYFLGDVLFNIDLLRLPEWAVIK